jgi:glutamyl/glutaminyl-tRNA synthetase
LDSFAPSYHWACAIDDYDGRYRLLARAADLAAVAAGQREIQRWLAGQEGRDPAASIPAIFHAALVTLDDGRRLEKRTRGATLDELARAGVGPEAVVSAFAASAMIPSREQLERDAVAGAILGEGREVLCWSELFGGVALG